MPNRPGRADRAVGAAPVPRAAAGRNPLIPVADALEQVEAQLDAARARLYEISAAAVEKPVLGEDRDETSRRIRVAEAAYESRNALGEIVTTLAICRLAVAKTSTLQVPTEEALHG